MTKFYDRQGRPMTLREWGKARDDRDGHRVGLDAVGEAEVSTVWLGMDHRWGQGPPLIFETMIFGGPHDQWQDRYSTEAAATEGHRAVVEALRNGTPLPGEAGRPEKVYVRARWDAFAGFWVVSSDDTDEHGGEPYVPESEVTRLRAEVEGAYREGYVDANGSDGNDPCAVDRDWENSLTRALLAARKEEG